MNELTNVYGLLLLLVLTNIFSAVCFWRIWRRLEGIEVSQKATAHSATEALSGVDALVDHFGLEWTDKVALDSGMPYWDITYPQPKDVHEQETVRVGPRKYTEPEPRQAVDNKQPYPLPLNGHTLLIGLSGSGKSNAVKGLIIAALEAKYEVWVVDTKEELGQTFECHCRIFDRTQAEEALQKAVQIAEDRRKLFAKCKTEYKELCHDLYDYNRITGAHLPEIMLVIEEVFDLSGTVDFDRLGTILATTRSAGVYVVCLSQYINNTVIPKSMSVNFKNRVFMGSYESGSAALALNCTISKHKSEEYDKWLGPVGRGILRVDGKDRQIEFPLVSEAVLRKYAFGEE